MDGGPSELSTAECLDIASQIANVNSGAVLILTGGEPLARKDIYEIASHGASLGLMVVGLYVIIQQFENHLIYPLVVRKVVGVPPLLVIIALIIGGKLAGFLGVLLAVPMAAAILEFTDDIQKEKHRALAHKE